jgi:ABC-2 type transport system permease protein
MLTSLIRASAFLRKEIYEIMRQPKLLLTLVAGPFFIMLLFGLGYSNNARPLRILFVAEKGSAVEDKINELAPHVTGSLIYEGVTDDQVGALHRLRQGLIDMVAIAPKDPYADLRSNKQAIFQLLYSEIDPVQAGYMGYIWQFFVQEINRNLLEVVLKQSQNEAANVQNALSVVKSSAKAMHEALDQADIATAKIKYAEMTHPIAKSESSLTPVLNLLDQVDDGLRNKSTNELNTTKANNEAHEMRDILQEIRRDVDNLQRIEGGKADYKNESATLKNIEDRIDKLSVMLREFEQISAPIIVRPLAAESKNISPIQLRLSDFFAPAVIVLLLQHLMVTVSSLSLVRERQSGSIELFRASPLSAFETLLGKYASYMLLGVALATVLTAVLIFVLGVPMSGSVWQFAVVVAALLFTALGFGCLISILADTDSQAVQYSMLILLGSVFFGGAFISLNNLNTLVRGVSWALPATYAIQMLQQIMLKGITVNWVIFGGLLLMGAGLFGLNYILLRNKMAHE